MRLRKQMISEQSLKDPAELLRWMVDVQAQDYFGALWGVGLRLVNGRLPGVEAAFASGAILRTHVMRPTWHFVAAEDIRWLLKLTAPRVHTANAYMYRQQNLDAKLLEQAHAAIENALRRGRQLTREELKAELEQAGIEAAGVRLAYIVMHAELEGLICSGPRRGKQFTYALLDDRAPQAARSFNHNEALAQFARRYFACRGPATLHDFANWSGLTIAQAGAGLEAAKDGLTAERHDGREFWFAEGGRLQKQPRIAYLLPNYDEYGSAYKDPSVVFNERHRQQMMDYSFTHLVVIDGKIQGSWRREIRKNEVAVEPRALDAFSTNDMQLIVEAAQRYQQFLGMDVDLIV